MASCGMNKSISSIFSISRENQRWDPLKIAQKFKVFEM